MNERLYACLRAHARAARPRLPRLKGVSGQRRKSHSYALALASLLLEFMTDCSLVATDLSYCSTVGFTYDGSCRSWIDHILCSKEFSSQISSIEAVGSLLLKL